MSLITIEQFEELAEDYPDLAQCYDFGGLRTSFKLRVGRPDLINATDSIDADTCPDQ